MQKLEVASDTNQYVQIEKWEWDDMKAQIIRLESQLMDQEQDIQQIRELKDRISWLEANR